LKKVTVEKERNIFNTFKIKTIIHGSALKHFMKALVQFILKTDLRLVIKFLTNC